MERHGLWRERHRWRRPLRLRLKVVGGRARPRRAAAGGGHTAPTHHCAPACGRRQTAAGDQISACDFISLALTQTVLENPPKLVGCEALGKVLPRRLTSRAAKYGLGGIIELHNPAGKVDNDNGVHR